MVKIDGMSKVISNLEGTVMKATQKMRKFNKNSGDNEKIGVLLKEVQNMKNQMFYLQQSVLQLRTQESHFKVFQINHCLLFRSICL